MLIQIADNTVETVLSITWDDGIIDLSTPSGLYTVKCRSRSDLHSSQSNAIPDESTVAEHVCQYLFRQNLVTLRSFRDHQLIDSITLSEHD